MKLSLALKFLVLTIVLEFSAMMGCKSSVEVTIPPEEPRPLAISVDNGVLYTNVVTAFYLTGKTLSTLYYCFWRIDADTTIFERANFDSVSVVFSKSGLHRISVQMFDSSDRLFDTAELGFIVSSPPIQTEILKQIHTVRLAVSGAFITRYYDYNNGAHAGVTIDTSVLLIQAPVTIDDGTFFYANTASSYSYTGTHSSNSYTSRSSTILRFKLEDNARLISAFTGEYHYNYQDGMPQQTTADDTISIRQVPFVRCRKDTLEYQVDGEEARTVLAMLSRNSSDSRGNYPGSSYYIKTRLDSLDWNSRTHPPKFTIDLYR